MVYDFLIGGKAPPPAGRDLPQIAAF